MDLNEISENKTIPNIYYLPPSRTWLCLVYHPLVRAEKYLLKLLADCCSCCYSCCTCARASWSAARPDPRCCCYHSHPDTWSARPWPPPPPPAAAAACCWCASRVWRPTLCHRNSHRPESARFSFGWWRATGDPKTNFNSIVGISLTVKYLNFLSLENPNRN